MFPLLDRFGDRYQNLLSDIIRIRFLHPLLPSQPQDDRPIDFDELMPRRLIGRIAWSAAAGLPAGAADLS